MSATDRTEQKPFADTAPTSDDRPCRCREHSANLAILTESEMAELKKQAEGYKRAQMDFAKAVGTLWNAQMETERAAGRKDLSLKPLHLWNDCSCCC